MELLNDDDVMALPWEYIPTGKLPCHKEHVSGVYMLVDKSTCEIDYIGKSVNIGGRLISHHHEEIKHAKDHDLYILRVADEAERQYIEARAIYFLHPHINERNGIGLAMSAGELDAGYKSIFNS